MAKSLLGQSSHDNAAVAQVVKDAHRVFWASLDAEENQTACDSKIFLQAVLCFLWAAADGCLPAWERASKPDAKELLSWSKTLHKETLGSHAGSPSRSSNNALAEPLASGVSQKLALIIKEQTKFLESVADKHRDASKEKRTK